MPHFEFLARIFHTLQLKKGYYKMLTNLIYVAKS